MFGDDADREQFFEAARSQAQREFEASDGKNAQALLRWGGALLELAHYKNGAESTDMIEMAIAKLKQCLELDPERADAEWCLGNAHTSLGFLAPLKPMALEHFSKAAECFKRCATKEPNNETYKKAIEMCDKAPEYYDEVQAQLGGAGAEPGGPPSKKEAASSIPDIVWDIGGWVLLVGAVTLALTLSRGSSPPASSAAAAITKPST